MKNWAICFVVFLVFAVPSLAVAQARGGGYDFLFGRHAVPGATASVAVTEETGEESRDLTSLEILRAFVEKGFAVTPEENTATFVAEVEIFSRERPGRYGYGGSSNYYRYYYHRDPESLVYLTVRYRENGGVVTVGRGKSANIRRAAEKAANDAAKKLRRYYKDERTIFLP